MDTFRFFQLKDIYIPETVVENWMKTLLETELALKEDFLQDAQIVRKETDQKVFNITCVHWNRFTKALRKT